MRVLTPQDVHVLVTDIARQATGIKDIAITDSSSYVSVGEMVLQTGRENTVNAISIVIGRTVVASRPITEKRRIIQAVNSGTYSSRYRKLSLYPNWALPAGFYNTDLFGENLMEGVDNTGEANKRTPSMWEQHPRQALEVQFSGRSVYQYCQTTYKFQLEQAFRNEADGAQFFTALMTEVGNDLKRLKSAWNEVVSNNYIAGTYALEEAGLTDGRVVNLTKAFNDEFGTAYTSKELQTTYATEFYKFLVATFQIISDRMAEDSALYHWSPDANNKGELLRQTTKARQRFLYYAPFFTKSRAYVFPEIFGPGYLKDIENQGEGVNWWQSPKAPTEIKWKAAIPDESGEQKASVDIELECVVGILYDVDAMMTDFQLDSADTTPMEARKKYYNTWYDIARNAINDHTENAVLFIMQDED